jgi:TnpA family transposase
MPPLTSWANCCAPSFLCDYFSKPEFRREMHALLDRGESVHQLQRAVHQGRIGTQRGRRRDELWAISGAHTLLTNAIIAWNTMKMQQVVDDWKARRHPIDVDAQPNFPSLTE